MVAVHKHSPWLAGPPFGQGFREMKTSLNQLLVAEGFVALREQCLVSLADARRIRRHQDRVEAWRKLLTLKTVHPRKVLKLVALVQSCPFNTGSDDEIRTGRRQVSDQCVEDLSLMPHKRKWIFLASGAYGLARQSSRRMS